MGLALVVVETIVDCGLIDAGVPGLGVAIVNLVSFGFPPLERHSSVVWEEELG